MDKKNALEISKFAGIDQLDRGTATPANFAHTLKNVHPVSLSELKTIEGVNDVSGGANLPAVDEIIHECIHKDFGGSEKRLVFFKPNITSSTNFGENLISASNFSATGGTSQNQNFYVVLYGAGGCYKTKEVFGVTLNSGNNGDITFTPPSGIPDFVCQINIYQIGIGSLTPGTPYNGALVASLTRRNGVFPSGVTFKNRTNATVSNPLHIAFLNQITPLSMAVASYGTSGSLDGGRIYYTGIASSAAPDTFNAFSMSYPRCRLYDQQGNPLSFFLPKGFSSAIIRYYFPNTTAAVNPITALTPGGPECLRAWFFLGTTPEDVLIGGKPGFGIFSGAYSPIERNVLAYAFQGVSIWGDTVFSNNFNFDDESPVLLRSTDPGSLPGGLQNNTVYWVKYFPIKTELKLATSYSNLKNNIFVDITSDGGNYSAHSFHQITFDVVYDHLPYNSNNGVTMVQHYSIYPRQMGGSLQQGDPNRRDGVFVNSQFYPGITMTSDQVNYTKGHDYRHYPIVGSAFSLGCWVLPDGVFNSNAYQLLANINEKNFSLTGFSMISIGTSITNYATTPSISPSLFWCPSDKVISSFQSTIRTYLANGDNGLFCTNGYVLKPMIRSNGKVYIPTSKYIYGFGTRLVCGGGPASYQNSKNQVYYSNPDLPFDWGTGAINTINVFTEQDINGFGAYSQNLTTSGFAQFLFISKKDGAFSWDGNPSNGPQQLYYGFGMASPRSFVETDFGPVFVSRSNIYILEGGSFREIGDNVQPILESLSDQQLERIIAVYHDKIVKIGYPSGTNTELDREIWLDQRIERGQAVRIYSGPHEMKPYRTQSTSIIFGTDRDVRYSSLGKRVYQRDIGKLNDGANINYSIVHNRLGFERDLFWKLITDIYVATLVQQDENITITLGFEDGTSNYVGTLACPVANTRQLCQHLIRSRPRGRIVSLTLSGSSNEPISIFNISILFELQKRRLLRYS